MSAVVATLLVVTSILVVIVLAVATASFALNAAYIVHELGWFPHTKDRMTPPDRDWSHDSRYDRDATPTHDFQVMHDLTIVARQHAHADVYAVKDPHQALQNVISRYEERPSRSRYDDLIHVSNHVSNHVRSDERVEELIGTIHDLMHRRPPEED
jgi:hypothetical protein